MQEIYIDFSVYSSLKIGAKLPIKVIELDVIGAKLLPYQTATKSSYTSAQIDSKHTKSLQEANKQTNQKLALYTNKTLHVESILPNTKRGFVELDSTLLRVIGRANNLLVSPNATNLALLGDGFCYIADNENYIEMGGAVTSMQAFLFCKKNDIQGLEFLKNLPGNIGALCNMNAGMKQYEMIESLSHLNINGKWIEAKEAGLCYRDRKSGGTIFAARFHKKKGFRHELLEVFHAMRKIHPKEASCGSCFKNPPHNYAGKLLEEAGMKGFFYNNVGFSEKHANFLVNRGGARYEDALKVIEIAQKKVQEKSGILLECEVQICK